MSYEIVFNQKTIDCKDKNYFLLIMETGSNNCRTDSGGVSKSISVTVLHKGENFQTDMIESQYNNDNFSDYDDFLKSNSKYWLGVQFGTIQRYKGLMSGKNSKSIETRIKDNKIESFLEEVVSDYNGVATKMSELYNNPKIYEDKNYYFYGRWDSFKFNYLK